MALPIPREKSNRPNVNFVREEVRRQLAKWETIEDCLGGQDAVKFRRTKYLPKPNPEDTSPENEKRYKSYLERAVFYNVTRRTLDGLVGQVFTRDPDKKLPSTLESMVEDADGAGVGIDQQSKKCLEYVMSKGRTGLLADFPPTTDVVTKADQEKGFVRPTITIYEPADVINWRTVTVGAKKMLSLVVLRETETVSDDGFESKVENRWRVLKLVNGIYTVEVWDEKSEVPVQSFIPQDAAGNPLDYIPFTFVGPRNNDEFMDDAPLYDLAVMNVAHYRNSADYEESCYLVGQPTPWFSGVTKDWVDNVWKGKVVLGSRSAVPLPDQGQAGLLQVDPNSMPKEAMEHKERQMVALGAKLVQERNTQRTLGEAQLEEAAESSILATAAKNVGFAYQTALGWCLAFAGGAEGTEIKYALNTDFPAARMTPEERAQLIAEMQGGGITFSEYRAMLRKAGIATLSDEDAKDELESMPPGMSPTKGPPLDPNKAKPAPGTNGKAQV